MGSGDSHAPVGSINRAALVAIEQRLVTAAHVNRTAIILRRGKPTLRAELDTAYFPPEVETVYYDIRWYTSGDFEVHYHENWTGDREWNRRWDRHPRHGSREHYHPPPDAGHPPEPAQYPSSYYDVIRHVERETIKHIETHPLLGNSS